MILDLRQTLNYLVFTCLQVVKVNLIFYKTRMLTTEMSKIH